MMKLLPQGKSHNFVYLIFQLLLSGDVELNPGPGDPRSILRTNSAKLTDAISSNLDKVAVVLFDKELIPEDTKDKALLKGLITDYAKASVLVGVLQKQLEASLDQRQYLIDICQVLINLQDQTLKSIANDMLEQLGANNTQQGTSTKQQSVPPPATGNNSGAGTEEPDTGYENSEGATAQAPVRDPPDVSGWFLEMKDIKTEEVEFKEDLVADVNIILITVTKKEYCAVMSVGKRMGEKYTEVFLEEEDVTFNLVMYGSYKVAVIYTIEQGPAESISMLRKVQKAINAQYVIAIGICYGMKEGKTKLGDVIVAKSIMDMSSKRVSDGGVDARPKEWESGPTLYGIFNRSSGFELESGEGESVEVHTGVLTSENTLVASQDYKKKTLDQVPQALGGEMEGAGIMQAAKDGKFEGIVIKGIADWGNKDKEPYRKWQKFVAGAAAKYVLYRLEKRASEKLKKNPAL